MVALERVSLTWGKCKMTVYKLQSFEADGLGWDTIEKLQRDDRIEEVPIRVYGNRAGEIFFGMREDVRRLQEAENLHPELNSVSTDSRVIDIRVLKESLTVFLPESEKEKEEQSAKEWAPTFTNAIVLCDLTFRHKKKDDYFPYIRLYLFSAIPRKTIGYISMDNQLVRI
jgi:hypothetical protein